MYMYVYGNYCNMLNPKFLDSKVYANIVDIGFNLAPLSRRLKEYPFLTKIALFLSKMMTALEKIHFLVVLFVHASVNS